MCNLAEEKITQHEMKPLSFLFVFFIAVFAVHAQNIRYVKPVSTGSGDGSSWANASHDLQAMMDSLKATGGQIWVVQGTYKPLHKAADTVVSGHPTGDRYKSFVLVKDVEVYGGFQGITTDTALSCRNWNFYETILSGDVGIPGDKTDNTFHVVISAGDVGTACLDGLTITDGNNTELSSVINHIYVNNQNISIEAGVGIYITNSSPLIKNVIIENNNLNKVFCSAVAIACNESESQWINLIIRNNKTNMGSIIEITHSSVIITNTLICNNESLKKFMYYGCMIENVASSLIITNSTIANNYNSYDTSFVMIYNHGYSTNLSSCVIRNSIIWNEYGGTVFSNEYVHEIYENNITGRYFGGIVQGTNPLFVNTTYWDYHLRPTSPAINAGNNAFYHPDSLPDLSGITTDLDGYPRINCIVDIGCYEYEEILVSYPNATTGKDTTVCYGDSANIIFNLTGNPNWDIVYTVNNGGSYDTVRNISDSTYILKAAFTDTTTYKLISISNNVCEGVILSDSMTIIVIPELSLISSIISDTLCNGEQTAEIIFESDVDACFNWEFISGDTTGLLLGEQTGNFGQYTVENNTTNPLTSLVKVFPYYRKDNIYCLGRDTHFTVTVLPEPELQTTLFNDTLCDGEQTKPIAFTGTATGFTWEATGNIGNIPAGVQTGNFGNYIVENKTEERLQSLIRVNPLYEMGNRVCFGDTKDLYIWVFPTTKIQSIVANKLLFCDGELLELTAEAARTDLSYQWYHNNSLLAGAVNEFYIIPSISRQDLGNYYIEATGQCGTVKSNTINIETSSDKIVIEKWNDVILVDNSYYEYYGYQWYRDDVPLAGATKQFYQELGGLNGCYSVELTFANGQKERSCERCIDNKTGKSLSVYPNPVRQGENIQIQITEEIISVQLYSMEGKLIHIGNPITKTLTTIGLQQGVYIIRIQTKEKIIYSKKTVVI